MSETKNTYEDRSRVGKSVKKIIKNELKGTASITEIEEQVKKHLPPEDSTYVDSVISNVLLSLKSGGYVKQIPKQNDIWEIYPLSQRIFGEGEGKVYVFYDRQVEQEGSAIWLCNVGSTARTVEERVNEQTDQWLKDPTIGLIIKMNDDYEELETKIHETLKIFKRKRKEYKGRKLKGTKWFETSPDEVIKIVTFIGDFIPNLCPQDFPQVKKSL